ncbi:MAG: phosphatidylserine/phosphatidylglycerophosphate/cardiolipin synthase family protein [Myxococcaceae bacterium]
MGDNRIGTGPRAAPLTPSKTEEKPKTQAAPAAPAPSKGWGPKTASTVAAAKTGLGGLLGGVEREASKLLGNAESSASRLVSNTEAGAQKLLAQTQKESARLLGNVESEVGKVGEKVNSLADAGMRTVTNLTTGLPQAVGSGLRQMFDFRADQNAFRNISAATPQQLASMSNDDLAKTAQELLNPSIPEKLFGASQDARSQQALRLLTAHGTDAGSMDSIATRLPYLRDPGKELSGPAAAQYKSLEAINKPKPGDWSGLQQWFDKATGTVNRPGTTVTPLINGQNAFPKMYEAIDGAKSSVNYTVFAFESDKTGWEMAKHLADAAKRGVDVKLIYDPMGSAKTDGAPTDQKIYQYMKDAGVNVIAQQPGPLAEHLTHRKITVVDGKTGFIGGMNCGENYSTLWHDCHSMVQGQGVADLQKLFVEQWKSDGGKVTPQEEKSFFPPLSNVGTSSARMVGHVGNDDQNMKLAYLRSIDTAQKQINIASPYFSDPDVVAHLKDAVKRGVDVSVVLPKTNNQKFEQDAERAMYKDMIAGGIKVYEYAGRPMAHDKVATFDGKLATIGSSNLDARSLGNNDEANVWSDDPKVAATLNEQLFALDKTQSHQITAKEADGYRTLINETAEAVSNHL